MTQSSALLASIEAGVRQLGLEGHSGLVPQLALFLQGLIKWNQAYNLTSIRDPQQMVYLHLMDSLAVVPYLAHWATKASAEPAATVLDVGSGAGLPGIPLALCYPQIRFVLLDSNGKKTRFLQQMQIELGLFNVTVVQARAEDYQGVFDGVICRAFASLANIVSTTQHLLAESGSLLAMKGKLEEDLPATDLSITEVHSLQVPCVEAERHLYVLGRHTNHQRGS